MKRLAHFTLILFTLCSAICQHVHAQQGEEIHRIDSTYLDTFFKKNERLNQVEKQTRSFYAQHDGVPLWFKGHQPIPQALLLVNTFDNLDEFGIVHNAKPKHKHLVDSLSMLKDYVETNAMNDVLRSIRWFDVTLTALYFDLFPRLWDGQLDPRASQQIEWHIAPPRIAYTEVLDSILNGPDTQNLFVDYRKFHPGFFALKNLLARFSSIQKEGGWPALHNKTLNQGDRSADVLTLTERLSIAGDLAAQHIDSVFSRPVANAVKNLQVRHGLAPDGIVGPRTIGALNVSVQDRIKQIVVNMERWRWLEPVKSNRYILVNIPQYMLYAYESGEVKMQMPVIVGKEASQTVIFNDDIKYIVVNPYWNIPKSIAVGEMLPRVKEDRSYLRDRHIEVGISNNYKAVDDDTIQWNRVDQHKFSYTFRQTPGQHNQLGTIKFIFPNKYSIYLHDTPARSLFDQRNRKLSHGCVRVSQPYRLAGFLLDRQHEYTEQKVKRIVRKQKPQDLWITLSEPVPVYLVYFTVWVDVDGTAHFRDDIYDHDQAMIEQLFRVKTT